MFQSFRILFALRRGQCVKFSNELIFQNRTPLNGKKEKQRNKKHKQRHKPKENIKTAEYFVVVELETNSREQQQPNYQK